MESSIGQKLRNARKDKELTLDQVSKELHIRAAYLKALEEENYQILPSPVQAKGFLKSYADFLHLQIEHNQTPFNGETTAAEIEQNGNQQKISQPDSSEKPSAILFKEIGAELQERREVLGLSRLDIEDHTHIPGHYIEYIESGAFDQFPSPTQARGMLINYVNFLNINPDRPMLKYAEALQSDLSGKPARKKLPPNQYSSPRFQSLN
ncbi:MAG: helix-turn-helix domain-containing protein [Anaerolineales bacterium]